MPRALLAVAAALALFAGITAASASAAMPPIKHVWIVVLENKDYDNTFGPGAGSAYLANTLTSQGQLLTQYYGIGHSSLDNYIAMVGGQPPTPQTQGDCDPYADFVRSGEPEDHGVARGLGCVYPADILTIADQLEAKGLTWKAYQEDMGISSPGRAPLTTCDHPAVGAHDPTEGAAANDQYATKHNPFMYYHSIIDEQSTCDAYVVDLSQLEPDLASTSTTPSYSFITPDLCADGHDANCADGVSPGGYAGIDAWLQTYIPKITGSPAYSDGGLVIVTFDETSTGADACCGETQSPNIPAGSTNGGGRPGPGGGRIGAVILSPYTKAGSTNDTQYNHYSLLRSTEDIFGVTPHLGEAGADGPTSFGDDVFNAYNPTPEPGPEPTPEPTPTPDPKPVVTITGVPKGCVPKSFKIKVKTVSKHLGKVVVKRDGHRIATKLTHSFKLKIKRKGLKKGKHKLVAKATDSAKRTGSKTKKFKVCR